MPILGLTDTDDGFGSGLPLIGRLHKGAPKEEATRQNGTTYTKFGKDLEYFRVTFEPGYEWLEPLWVEMYGENPDWFNNIFLCGDTTDEVFPTWNEEWNSQGAMLHKCDGANQVAQWNGSMYVTAKVACIKGRDVTGKQIGCGCKQTGRLMIAIPDFIEASGVFGQFMVTTHSINDIIAVFKILKGIEKRVGRVSGIPFSFGRAPQEISAPKQEKVNGQYQVNGRVNVVKSLFVLYPDPTYTREILLPQMTQLALPAPQQPLQVLTPSMPYTPSDKPRILGRDNVITLPSQTPQTNGTAALQPAPDSPPTPQTDSPTAVPPEAKKTGDWATPENLDFIFKRVRTELKDETLADRELAGLVGIKESDVRSKIIWDAQFLTGQLAFDGMVEAFNTPRENTAAPPPPEKTSAIVTKCMYLTYTEEKQRKAHFIFDIAGLADQPNVDAALFAKQPRVYSRENMKRLVRLEYYNANPFEDIHNLVNAWRTIAPLEIEWEARGNGDDKTYLVTTKAKPVMIDSTPAESAPATDEPKSEFTSTPPPDIDPDEPS